MGERSDTIRILFLDGSQLNFTRPQVEGFDFPTWVHGCRSLGFIMAQGGYVPMHIVKGIFDMSTQLGADVEYIHPTHEAPAGRQ